ncbi:carbohydrate ABC transporter permease [Alicyclobacillus tolerans]|uniref:carbohydrate ABC transporter permease n=1 Tax=Alicyclobacillus tolerans TaxID=90970 RepID=UPI001F2C5E13|nr:carbohydrate ABC transporter permease [Alicyclobacillus tolerans]MCF8566425.1 carbohydrate ABC transporter permease [Alicyclobacillus tolerans]
MAVNPALNTAKLKPRFEAKSRRKWASTVHGLVLAAIALVWGFPTLWVLYEAFFDSGKRIGFTLQNFVQAFASAPFAKYSVNTVVIVFGLLAVQLVTGAAVGFVLARFDFPLKSLVTAVFVMQIVIPIYAVMIEDYQILRAMHLLDTKAGLMLPYAVSGIAVLSFRQAFRSVPRELEEAARLDGYRMFGIFRRVYLPQAVPAALAFAVISVTYHWTDFLWPMIVTNTAQSRPIVVGLAMLAQSSESGMQWNLLAAGTAIVIIPVLLVFVAATKKILRAFSTTFNW